MQVGSLGREDPPEEVTAAHSSILAWRIPWAKEPGRLQCVGHKELDTTEYAHTHTIKSTELLDKLKGESARAS